LTVYSSSESDEDEWSGNQDWAWDPKQLEKIQLDDITIKRHYIKLSCQKSDNKQDNRAFIVNREILLWPHNDVAF